eukprot:scaffold7344_cov122-Amphora_coffeaeformis.AAC.5
MDKATTGLSLMYVDGHGTKANDLFDRIFTRVVLLVESNNTSGAFDSIAITAGVPSDLALARLTALSMGRRRAVVGTE